MPNSVNSILQKYQTSTVEEISNMTPAVLSAELLILSAKFSMVGAEIMEAEKNYSTGWIILRENSKTDKETDIRMKATQEYADLLKAKYLEKSVLETLRAIKKFLQSKESELRMLNY